MGGRVGLKGTDGVVQDALDRGAQPMSSHRGSETLKALAEIMEKRSEAGSPLDIEWSTCKGPMGEDSFIEAGFTKDDLAVVYQGQEQTTAEDTRNACEAFLKKGVDLVVFVGGDGTARDVYSVLEDKTLMLGIPSGVKMHSGVFCVRPEVGARVILAFVDDQLDPSKVEIMDLDEERYRKGEWNIKIFGYAITPYEPTYIQGGKVVIREPEEDVIEDIAWYMKEMMGEEPGTLYILGAGGTLNGIAEELSVEKSLLGIDAVLDLKTIALDVNESSLLELLDKYPDAKIFVSPIGAQGFVLGRGSQQLSPAVIRKVGLENFNIVATPAKLDQTPILRVDTGDPKLDREFAERKHLMVICGDHFKRLHPLGPG